MVNCIILDTFTEQYWYDNIKYNCTDVTFEVQRDFEFKKKK